MLIVFIAAKRDGGVRLEKRFVQKLNAMLTTSTQPIKKLVKTNK